MCHRCLSRFVEAINRTKTTLALSKTAHSGPGLTTKETELELQCDLIQPQPIHCLPGRLDSAVLLPLHLYSLNNLDTVTLSENLSSFQGDANWKLFDSNLASTAASLSCESDDFIPSINFAKPVAYDLEGDLRTEDFF